MPSLSRKTQPLLAKIGGKSSSANRPATTPSPSSVPQPAPLPEGKNLTDDPESSSANEEGSDNDNDNDKIASSALSSLASSPQYKVPKGRKEIRAQRFPGGRGATMAAANGKRAREDDDEDMMGLFDVKRSRATYGIAERSFASSGGSGKAKKAATTGHGAKSRAKSAHSTPAKNIHAIAKTSAASTGRANKKGTPFSDVSINTTTLPSAERVPGECVVGDGKEERRPRKMLKQLEPIALPPRSRRVELKARHVEKSETRSPTGKPRVKILAGAGALTAARKENNAMIKKLPAINFPLQTRSPPKIMTLAPIQPPPSPADCTRGSTSLSQSQDCEMVDLTTSSVAITPGNSKSDASSKDTPTKRKTIKTLPSIDNTEPKTTATRRSSRRNRGQAPDDSTHLPQRSSSGNVNIHDDDDDSNIKVSSPIGGDFGDLDDDDDDDGPNPNGNYERPDKCPICQAPVDRILLEEWQGSRAYMRIRKQMAFCEAHRRATAQEEYAARDYPDIDFDALASQSDKHSDGDGGRSSGGRIERFRDKLIGIVRRERVSAFRDAADAAAAKGEGRNLKTTAAKDEALTGMSVGYYGPRGRRVMEAWVTRELADEIREAAGRDRLIGFKTVSGFIQEVLVPELAMRLVAEDLDVGEARAREVLRESGEIGELVNGVDDDREEGEGAEKVVAKQPVGASAADDDGDEDGGDY